MLKQDKEGYYIVESLLDLKLFHRMTDVSHIEKLKLKSEFKKNLENIKKESVERQKSGKNIVKLKTKKVEKPEKTDFDKWFNYK
jgi:hypothetical protein